MKVFGIIMETNPLHNGHSYFIKKIKEIYQPDVLIAITSTSFTMRGDISVIDKLTESAKDQGASIIIIDFHAEATAEKRAMGFYVDGKVSAIFGTHTHTQTSDNQILPNGTGYITDIGMTGPYYSVLGVAPSCAIEKLKTGLPTRFVNEDGVCVLEGCLFDIDEKSGKTVNTKLIRR